MSTAAGRDARDQVACDQVACDSATRERGGWDWAGWDPDRVARAVLSCRGVAGLVGAPGPDPAVATAEVATAAEVATYLPGRRVRGVRVRPDGILVQVVGRYGTELGELAARVRRAVLAAAPGCPRVDVVIRDLAMSEAQTGDPDAPPAPVAPASRGRLS